VKVGIIPSTTQKALHQFLNLLDHLSTSLPFINGHFYRPHILRHRKASSRATFDANHINIADRHSVFWRITQRSQVWSSYRVQISVGRFIIPSPKHS
jgi:hypothetical protein